MVKTVEIVSLSSGVIGESFVAHEVERGVRRLEDFGLRVKFAAHARMGLDYVRDHPEARAEDLLNAFRDSEVDMIMTAIGGDDTYRLLQGASVFSGAIFGGCLDTIFDMFDGTRYADMPELCRKYDLFPSAEEWRGKILLLETSEEKMPPEKYAKAVAHLRDAGVFDAVSGVLVGKPMNEAFDAEYRALLLETVPAGLPVVWNLSVGHASPHCILPFGVKATMDAEKQTIAFS